MLPQTKNGEGRIVYLNQLAVSGIGALPVRSEPRPMHRLFPDLTSPQVSVTFQRACLEVIRRLGSTL